ncbi:MAG: hypothetical protein KIS94_15995 [Chitinophagales bacterium]|nr:hypothetical protein [Chitinophagales bacterium]
MKTKILTAFATVILLFMQKPLIAQWITNGTTNNFFAQPDNTTPSSSDYIRSIGIGYFGSNYTNSLLHIDGNNILLPQNNSIVNAGEVFRTDAPNSQSGDDTYWRMLHGGTQVFNINNPYNSNNVALGTVQSGNLNFFTGNTQKATILANGNVGIGTTAPAYTLQVNGTIAAKQILIEDKTETLDLLVLLTRLRTEVDELKQKLRCVAENDFVTSKTE